MHTPIQPPVHHKEAYLKKAYGREAYFIESNHERDIARTGALSCIDQEMYQRLSEMPVRRNGPGLPFQPRGGRRTCILAFPLQQIQTAGRQLQRGLIDRLSVEKT